MRRWPRAIPTTRKSCSTSRPLKGRAGELAKAVESLEKATTLDRNDPRGWFLLGKITIQRGDAARALNDYLVRALTLHNQLHSEQGQAETPECHGRGLPRAREVSGGPREVLDGHRHPAPSRRRARSRHQLEEPGSGLRRHGPLRGGGTRLAASAADIRENRGQERPRRRPRRSRRPSRRTRRLPARPRVLRGGAEDPA